MLRTATLLIAMTACAKPAPAPTRPTDPAVTVAVPPDAPAPAPTPIAPTPPPPPPVCMGNEPNADAIRVTTSEAVLCAGEAPAARACWRVDLATRTVAPAPVAPAIPETGTPPRATRLPDGRVEVCPIGKACTTITPGVKLGEDAAIDADPTGTFLVRAGDTFELYTIAPWKRRMRLTRTSAAMEYGSFDWVFLGDRVLVFEAVSPVSSRARIVTLDGKVLGTIGDKNFSQQPHEYWPVDGTTYAFKDIDGVRLVVADVASGKTLATHRLDALLVTADDHPMIEAAGFAADATVLVFAGRNGVVGVIDRATGKVSTVAIPRCAAPAP